VEWNGATCSSITFHDRKGNTATVLVNFDPPDPGSCF
jgi:hypothetical protein